MSHAKSSRRSKERPLSLIQRLAHPFVWRALATALVVVLLGSLVALVRGRPPVRGPIETADAVILSVTGGFVGRTTMSVRHLAQFTDGTQFEVTLGRALSPGDHVRTTYWRDEQRTIHVLSGIGCGRTPCEGRQP